MHTHAHTHTHTHTRKIHKRCLCDRQSKELECVWRGVPILPPLTHCHGNSPTGWANAADWLSRCHWPSYSVPLLHFPNADTHIHPLLLSSSISLPSSSPLCGRCVSRTITDYYIIIHHFYDMRNTCVCVCFPSGGKKNGLSHLIVFWPHLTPFYIFIQFVSYPPQGLV